MAQDGACRLMPVSPKYTLHDTAPSALYKHARQGSFQLDGDTNAQGPF